jgi:hypothetical protein
MQVFCDDESTHINRILMRGKKAEHLRTPLDTNKSTLKNPEDTFKSPLLTKGKQNATTNKDGTAAGKANDYSRKLSSLPHDLSQQETTSTASTTKQPALSTDEVKQHNDCKPPPPIKSLCVFDPYDIKLTRTYRLLKGISEPVKQPNQLEVNDNSCPRADTAPTVILQDYPDWTDDVDEQQETSDCDALVKEEIKEAHRLLGFAKKGWSEDGFDNDGTLSELSESEEDSWCHSSVSCGLSNGFEDGSDYFAEGYESDFDDEERFTSYEGTLEHQTNSDRLTDSFHQSGKPYLPPAHKHKTHHAYLLTLFDPMPQHDLTPCRDNKNQSNQPGAPADAKPKTARNAKRNERRRRQKCPKIKRPDLLTHISVCHTQKFRPSGHPPRPLTCKELDATCAFLGDQRHRTAKLHLQIYEQISQSGNPHLPPTCKHELHLFHLSLNVNPIPHIKPTFSAQSQTLTHMRKLLPPQPTSPEKDKPDTHTSRLHEMVYVPPQTLQAARRTPRGREDGLKRIRSAQMTIANTPFISKLKNLHSNIIDKIANCIHVAHCIYSNDAG